MPSILILDPKTQAKTDISTKSPNFEFENIDLSRKLQFSSRSYVESILLIDFSYFH